MTDSSLLTSVILHQGVVALWGAMRSFYGCHIILTPLDEPRPTNNPQDKPHEVSNRNPEHHKYFYPVTGFQSSLQQKNWSKDLFFCSQNSESEELRFFLRKCLKLKVENYWSRACFCVQDSYRVVLSYFTLAGLVEQLKPPLPRTKHGRSLQVLGSSLLLSALCPPALSSMWVWCTK